MGKAKHNPELTKREKEILILIADGKSASEIAEELGLSKSTAIAHCAHIRLKLDIHNVADLIKYALRNNLTSLEQ